MTEMEDRLKATSEDLRSAQAVVDQQQGLLSDAGLVDEDDSGIRAGVSDFLEQVDVSGVIAASYNHRLVDGQGSINGGNSLFRHPDANTFALDQFWMVVDKPVTEDSRGGFHVEFVTGQTGLSQGGESQNEPYLYSGYVSYLAPIGDGVQVDAGRLATPLGAEVEQTNGNFNITQGNVFALQPVTHTGVSFSTPVSDEVSTVFGIVNGVYSDTFTSTTNDKAYYGQVAFSGDSFGVNVGFITGDDTSSGGGDSCAGADCAVTVVDVVITADPTDDLSLWANFDYVNNTGNDYAANGVAYGIAGAGRLAVTEKTGLSTRVEFVSADEDFLGTANDVEVVSVTGTADHTLAEGLVVRGEVRWDTATKGGNAFANNKEDQVIAIAEIYYAF
ncbi:MAG: outer membrane beta-barrel protein [Deltaproteobacteria bacterium]|nr:outer membrane beta-barrel protein [Deltaproteobacteria bacterium]